MCALLTNLEVILVARFLEVGQKVGVKMDSDSLPSRIFFVCNKGESAVALSEETRTPVR